MATALPNPTHHALADLEASGLVSGVITQNVDGLHQAAGSRRVVELHGSLAAVTCLDCSTRISRAEMQERLLVANPGWIDRVAEGPTPASAPDGDAEVEGAHEQGFRVPACNGCGGMLKPDVVFFGENVPRPRVDEAWALVDEADVLLVVGSSLTVFSGRRFVYGARDREMPIAILTMGPTRADDLASAKVEGLLGELMPRLVQALKS
jgi:NAD-dependent SIR2 family protein deacetylase